ncbi:MAG: CinA family protein [Tistlia sp.]|uniref:CinA family protein n=1 Tax=Tistlia sp. TaxID=3057121 RepID=UPI0034A4FC16
MFSDELIVRAAALIEAYRAAGSRLATAESCTGGLVAGLLTEIAGSSAVLERGFVTYSNEAKQELLAVPAETLAAFGAVSAETAEAMAAGALAGAHAEVAVSVTGIAGPDGGSADKPVGLVFFGLATARGVFHRRRLFSGDRQAVRLASVREALALLREGLG